MTKFQAARSLGPLLAGALLAGPGVSAFHGRGTRRGIALGGFLLLSIGEFAAGTVPRYPVGVVAMALAGTSFALVTTSCHAAIQLLAPARSRGRAVAAYLMALRAGGGVGALVLAWLAATVGVTVVITISGALALVLVAAIGARPRWTVALDAAAC